MTGQATFGPPPKSCRDSIERRKAGRAPQYAQELVDLIVDQLPNNEARVVVTFVSRT